jgi:hypothetical protein
MFPTKYAVQVLYPRSQTKKTLRVDGTLDIYNQSDDQRNNDGTLYVYRGRQTSVPGGEGFLSEVFALTKSILEATCLRTIVRAIDHVYNQAALDITAIIEDIPGRVAFTCDGCSSRVMRRYFVVKLHWICAKSILSSFFLEFRYFPSSPNAVTTCEVLKLMLQEYSLQTRIRAITTDSASEMRPAMRILCDHLNSSLTLAWLNHFHVHCICHVMNRAAIDAERDIEAEVSMVRELLKIVRAAVRMREEFASIKVGWVASTS